MEYVDESDLRRADLQNRQAQTLVSVCRAAMFLAFGAAALGLVFL